MELKAPLIGRLLKDRIGDTHSSRISEDKEHQRLISASRYGIYTDTMGRGIKNTMYLAGYKGEEQEAFKTVTAVWEKFFASSNVTYYAVYSALRNEGRFEFNSKIVTVKKVNK